MQVAKLFSDFLYFKEMRVLAKIAHLLGQLGWPNKWLGRQTHDQKVEGSIPDPGSQTVV